MKDPFREMISFFKDNPLYLIIILLVIVFFYLVGRTKKENTSIKRGRCPMCGGNIIKEDGIVKCVNYPKCRYKK